MLSDRFDEAFRFAHELHRVQRRKGMSIPYISHLMTVAALVLEHGGSEAEAIAGLLHDAPEDQGGAATLAELRRGYGDVVTRIVSDCTTPGQNQSRSGVHGRKNTSSGFGISRGHQQRRQEGWSKGHF
jgi:(p)ppGpp synthase/HD superfamily hydrolase